ncbi:penicillin-binding protein 2 [Candidatus Saccharibacteria bacterium]|nr:penicillin-binding protein 2 [Candidatus Saccharibacteria bacterium]
MSWLNKQGVARQAPSSNRRPVPNGSGRRLALWYGVLLFILAIFLARLFYLQIVRHDYYRQAALSDQLKEYDIPASRGLIKAHQGSSIVPLVLNEKLYTLYADPLFIKDAAGSAAKVVGITHGNAAEYEKAMKTKDSRYQVLAKRLSEDQKNKITELKLPGVGTQGQDYRTYPQGSLAAQILGFVGGEGKGTYGVEEYLDKKLAGTAGKLKAITDVAGVPLAASRENVQISPKDGSDIVLSLDLGMQKQLETLLAAGIERSKSPSGSAIIMDPNTGAVRAMANYPTYDPAQYFKVSDPNLFNNAAVSSPLEVGSVMKTLTASAALDLGVVKADTSYSDPNQWKLDNYVITNIEEIAGPGTHSLTDILNQSINTGAVWLLMQMGGKTGEVTQAAREKWHDYMVNRFRLGKATGIEQGYEASGFIPDPKDGYALQLTYANTAFGQAMTATPLQMLTALASILNGGTYYRPYLVEQVINGGGQAEAKKPEALRTGVVAAPVGETLKAIMEYSVAHHSFAKPFPANFSVGGKTGTAQIANPAGGYYGDRFNGTYLGFVGGDKIQYVIAVRVNEPKVGKYAGSGAAQPLFGDIAHMLINDFNVAPRSGG